MIDPLSANLRSSSAPPRPPATPSPRPDSSRPLSDINNTVSTTASTPSNLNTNGGAGRRDSCKSANSADSLGGSTPNTPLSSSNPVYLKYTKQQQKQQGMFIIQHTFLDAKENTPATSRGSAGSSLFTNAFTHEFPYCDDTSEDDDDDYEDDSSTSDNSFSNVAPSPLLRKALTEAAKSQSLLQEYYCTSSPDLSFDAGAQSEDSTLKDSLNSPSSMYSPASSGISIRDEEDSTLADTLAESGKDAVSSPRSKRTIDTSTLESLSTAQGEDSTLADSSTTATESLQINSGEGQSSPSTLYSSSDVTVGNTIDLKYSSSKDTGASIDLKYSISNVSDSPTNQSPNHLLSTGIPDDEPTPVVSNTASSRIPSPDNNTLNSLGGPYTPHQNEKTVIEWATPRPRENDVSPSMSLPSMLGGSAFDVSELESPSLLAQTTMTSYGSSDIHSQSIAAQDEACEMMSMGGMDRNSNNNIRLSTPSMVTMKGRPPRSTLNGLSTPELWSHARNNPHDKQGLQSAPASLAMDEKSTFFRSGIPTPSPRNDGGGGDDDTKEEYTKVDQQQGGLTTPMTLHSLLADTLELHPDEPQETFAHGISCDQVEGGEVHDKEEGPGKTFSEYESQSSNSEGNENADDAFDDVSRGWTEIVPPPSLKDQDGNESDAGSSCQIQSIDSLDAMRRRFRRACWIRAAIAICILLAGLIALGITLVPLAKEETPEEIVKEPSASADGLTSEPSTDGEVLDIAPIAAPSTSVPTISANRPPSLLEAGTPTASPHGLAHSPVTFPPVVTRPTTPGGAPIERPSATPPGPSGPPVWTAVLQGEQFWTDIDVHIELAWQTAASGDKLNIEIVSALDDVYDEYVEDSISDWNSSTFMNLSYSQIPQGDVFCQPEIGKIKICSADYGNVEMRGHGQLFLRGRFIAAATIQFNDYHDFDPYQIQYELCHLLGHSFGLYHGGSGCMTEYTSGGTDDGDDNKLHPSSETLQNLEELYGSNNERRTRQLRINDSRKRHLKRALQMKREEGHPEVYTFHWTKLIL